MYTNFKFKDSSFFKRIFPDIIVGFEFEEKVKNLFFLGQEFSSGFKIRKAILIKKIKEISDIFDFSKIKDDTLIVQDQEAESHGSFGSE